MTGDAGEHENTYRAADNGSGFDPAKGEILFQPFQRGATREDVEGSGLGLAIVARIVRKLTAGASGAESFDGSTEAQRVFVHRAEPPSWCLTPAPGAGLAAPASHDEESFMTRFAALVVDDDKVFRESLAALAWTARASTCARRPDAGRQGGCAWPRAGRT